MEIHQSALELLRVLLPHAVETPPQPHIKVTRDQLFVGGEKVLDFAGAVAKEEDGDSHTCIKGRQGGLEDPHISDLHLPPHVFDG